jgi:hypothetical protein
MKRSGALLAALLLAGCATKPLPVVQGECGAQPPEPPVCRQAVPASVRLLGAGYADVRVDARCHWNHSGVRLEANGNYRITVTGRPIEDWVDKTTPADPLHGWTERQWLAAVGGIFARAPSLPLYALAAAEGKENPAFHALAGPRVATGAGELLLFANDWASMYGNNKGCLAVRVERVR